jgi:nitrogenase molybdenum-iron protein NifN
MFERLCGLEANDALMTFLTDISGRPAPMKYRRQRGQLVDAMLDGHFHIGGRKLAVGAEPDLLNEIGGLLTEVGAQLLVAVTTTQSPVLERLPTEEVLIGDLEDLENLAKAKDCDLMVTFSREGKRLSLEDTLLSYGHSDVRPPRRRPSIDGRLSRRPRSDL